MNLTLTLTRDVPGLGHPNTKSLIRRAASAALQAEGVSEDCVLSVLLTDDEGIRCINAQFRNMDRPTDVLSFPMNDLQPGHFDPELCERDPDSGEILLGDMVLSIPRCLAQGEEFGHGYDREVQYLTVHSVLHLLGYDHVDEGPMKKQMRAREKLIMGD